MSLNKDLINSLVKVTSRAAINCYQYLGKGDKKLADKYLKDHIDSVRKHLFGPKGLDKKNYNKLYGINSLKHVIVFFPADELYTITLKGDITLQNDAFKKGFIFSSPNNLNNLIAVFEQIKSEKKQIENI